MILLTSNPNKSKEIRIVENTAIVTHRHVKTHANYRFSYRETALVYRTKRLVHQDDSTVTHKMMLSDFRYAKEKLLNNINHLKIQNNQKNKKIFVKK